MKSFLLLLALCLAITAFGQKQFYGTLSANYTTIEYADYYSGMTFQQTIEQYSSRPSVTLGIGYQLPISKKMSGQFLLDLSYLSGKFDYKSNSGYWYKLEGELICKGTELRLMPQFNFKFTEKINGSVGTLLGLRAIHSIIRGQAITYATYENNQWVAYPSPIVDDAYERGYGAGTFPKTSTGVTMAVNYQLKPAFELFGRFVLERDLPSYDNDTVNIYQAAIGLNYYLKTKK